MKDLHIQANTIFHTAINRRNSLIESIRTCDCPQNKFFEAVLGKSDSKSCWKPFHKLQFQSCGACEPFLPATLAPLDECIIAIVWEAANSISCRDVFFASPFTRLSNLWDLAVLIKSAASYQTKSKSVSGISSLIGRQVLTGLLERTHSTVVDLPSKLLGSFTTY